MKRLLLFALCSAAGLNAAAPTPPVFRLPTDVVPKHYALEMRLDPAESTFSGVITIELEVRKPSSVVWLNASHLEVSRAVLEQTNAPEQTAHILPAGEQLMGFAFDHPIPAQSARLKVTYTGSVNLKSGAGIFLNKRNEDRYLFTQFEPVDARLAFPCFDEPSFKVPWQVTVHIPAEQVAVSNTPVLAETPEGTTKKVVFKETKPLPSYLIALGVGPLEFVDAGTAGRNKVPVRIVVPRGDAPRAKYAAQVTAEILTQLENYFDIPYPYEKSDQLSIPVSFGGAMENPGLVTYDSAIILAPPGGADPIDRQREYVSVATHELGHQWFGDLVTMAWWNDTWLNESFATFLQQKIEATWKPEWKTRVEDQDARLFAMWLDRLQSGRRIDQPVNANQDIGTAFDGITYQKGAAVLQMFDHSMPEGKFREAVRFYLKQHAFGNGTAKDFEEALRERGGMEVPVSFRTFLEQSGVPEIRMNLSCEGNRARLQLAQQRFLPRGSETSKSQQWQVPVCVSYEQNGKRAKQCSTLKEQTGGIELSGNGCPAWFLGNAEEVGYYYTSYEPTALESLIQHRNELTLAEQVGLFGEMSNLRDAGKRAPSEGLKLAKALSTDPHRQLVQAATQLAGVHEDFLSRDLRLRYAEYIRDLFGPRARALTWLPKPTDSEDDQLIRPELVTLVAGIGEDPELIASASKLANQWLETRTTLPPEIMRDIFRIAGRNGDAQLRTRILAATKKEKDEFYLRALYAALGSFRQPELVEQNLEAFENGAFDLRLSFFSLFFTPTQTVEVQGVPLAFIKTHYDSLVAKLPRAIGSDYAAFLPRMAGVGCSTEAAAEAESFFGPRMKSVDGGERTLAEAVEGIRLCAARKTVQKEDLARFFRAYVSKPQGSGAGASGAPSLQQRP